MLGQESEELTPFVIPQEDVEVLHASEGFCMLRNYLARDTRCVLTMSSAQSSTTWLGSNEPLLTPHQLLRTARCMRCTDQRDMDSAARLAACAGNAGARAV